MMEHKFDLKRRESRKKLPPEKLLNILRGIYPLKVADDKFKELTGIDPNDGGISDAKPV